MCLRYDGVKRLIQALTCNQTFFQIRKSTFKKEALLSDNVCEKV